MNKKEKMYIEIENHGKKIIEYFNLKDVDLIQISKRLFSLENKMHKACENYCNGIINEVEINKIERSVLSRIEKILNTKQRIFINHDPRGCSLKIEIPNTFYMQDWGGYGILAPNFGGE